MQKTKVKISVLLFLCIGLFSVQAQEGLPAAGGNASGSGGTVSFSVGQTNYITSTGVSGSVAAGVQQPYEISIIIGIEEANNVCLYYSVYPNPVIDEITLKVEKDDLTNMSYQLYDIGGKLLENKMLTERETTIFMKNMLPATYFLRISLNDNEMKLFKIIKN
ncbi:MAG: hypothetical protein CVU11_04025 [Bacteroidetes bacterium HGW-Bacteroidetes-6]|jgi:hypothetical protein|nr:MAG: hypothetical protein CVU11_04025 [Bacteroidetes bacterium HGW-Bacteroidetes-6]